MSRELEPPLPAQNGPERAFPEPEAPPSPRESVPARMTLDELAAVLHERSALLLERWQPLQREAEALGYRWRGSWAYGSRTGSEYGYPPAREQARREVGGSTLSDAEQAASMAQRELAAVRGEIAYHDWHMEQPVSLLEQLWHAFGDWQAARALQERHVRAIADVERAERRLREVHAWLDGPEGRRQISARVREIERTRDALEARRAPLERQLCAVETLRCELDGVGQRERKREITLERSLDTILRDPELHGRLEARVRGFSREFAPKLERRRTLERDVLERNERRLGREERGIERDFFGR